MVCDVGLNWPWRRRRESPKAEPSPRTRRFSIDVPPEITGISAGAETVAPRIGRREALQVPAVLRARNLIAGSLGTLPVRVHGPDRSIIADVQYLVPQPDPDIATSVVMAQTVEDLLFEGVAWWRVTRFGWHGYPVEAQHVPTSSITVVPVGSASAPYLPSNWISPDEPFPTAGSAVYIDGQRVDDRELIRFDSPNPPLLVHAARAIRTCLLLDQSAALYAKDPLPLGYFSPKDGTDPAASDDEIQEVLDDWESARSSRAWGYVGAALDAKTLQWSPEQLQLADARQHAVLEVARAAGVDPEDLGVSTTSRTYQNGEQRRQDFTDFTLGAYVSAIQDRLSMRDVLPRGYVARIDFAGFLRSDTQTRMNTYKVGLEVGAYTPDEIRELEDRPPLKPSQRPQPAQPAVPAQPGQQETPATDEAAMSAEPHVDRYDFGAMFTAGESTNVTFDSAEVTATFRVNVEKRTVSGMVIPWGKIARNGFAKWRFAENSLHWSSDVSRVKLNLEHDPIKAVGKALRLQPVSAGLDATFYIAKGDEGDRVLSLAQEGILDGFSVEVDFNEGDDWRADPTDESVRLVDSGTLRGVALTASPAFDDARVTSVAASRETNQGETMDEPQAQQEATPAGESAATFQTPDLTAFTAGLSDAIGQAVTEAFARLPLPQHGADDRDPVPAGRVQVTREEPVYSFTGTGPSLVRDAWHARIEGNRDSSDRLRKFGRQQQDMVQLFQRRPDLAFAVTTGNAASVIPPGYRPDLYVTQLLQGRPFVDAVSRGGLTDATPFVVPKFTSATGAAGNHTEGVADTPGSLSLGTITVTPGGVSGKFQLSREIIDSANPAIDAIAFQAMREAYSQNTEAKVYAELNGANGQAGTITAGLVPSGAQAGTSTGGSLAAGTFGGEKLIPAIRAAMAVYPFKRFAAMNRAMLSQEGTSALAGAVGTDGRPLLPSVGAQNTAGIGNAVQQGWYVDGLPFTPAWSMTANAAGDADVMMFNSQDVWAWESPLLTFRFEEKSGPELIELALFGYFATRILRPVGLSAIRHTVGA